MSIDALLMQDCILITAQVQRINIITSLENKSIETTKLISPNTNTT